MRKLIIFAIISIGGMLLLELIFGQSPDKRNFEFSPDMARSVAYKAQSPNPFFASGFTQQAPVESTIARGYLPFRYGASVEESIRAGDELKSPFDAENPADLKRGQHLYQTFCQVCHGAGGAGDGPVARRGFPPPPSLLLDNARNMQDGQIFHIITFGFKNMPAYAAQIERADRWHVIAYIRKLQENQP
ncbi:MAG: c-type cytochrome [bacterium]